MSDKIRSICWNLYDEHKGFCKEIFSFYLMKLSEILIYAVNAASKL